MKLVNRYLLREYLTVVGYCLLAFVMILFLYDLFDNVPTILKLKPPLEKVLLYYALTLAPSLEYLAPASLLLATLYTLWQFTRRHELTAMRAGGMSIFRIMLPFVGVGLAFTLLTIAIKELVTPRAERWTRDFVSRVESHEPAVYHDVAHYNSLGRRQWLIGRLDTSRPDEVDAVRVTCERADGTRYLQIEADRAKWLDGQWWFFHAVRQEFDHQDNPIGQPEPVKPPGGSDVVEMDFLDEKPQDFADELTNWDFLSSGAIYRYLRRHPALSPRDLAQKELTLHQRLALPWACLIVTVFAFPAGVRGGRRSAVMGIVLTVLFFFGFYALMQVGALMAMRLLIRPWLGAWLSNIVFLGGGLVMSARIR
jgi:lipopolysaccharide export system permease protein